MNILARSRDAPVVLIADDDPGVRADLRAVLEQDAVRVIDAADGARAIQLAHDERPDVVLMDLRMPGTDGVRATREIKAFLPLTQVVILTVYGDPALSQEATAASAYAYLLKGCSPQLVMDVIRQAFRFKVGLEIRQQEALEPGPTGPDGLAPPA